MRTLRAADLPRTVSSGFAAMAMAVVLGSGFAQAQGARSDALDPDANEVPIGTFNIGPSHDGVAVQDGPAGVPVTERDASEPDSGTGRWFFQSVESASSADLARRLYADARKALDTGRTTDAQRLLERLIAEAPDSELAGEARQHLGRIYRTVETGGTGPIAAEARAAEPGTVGIGATGLGTPGPDVAETGPPAQLPQPSPHADDGSGNFPAAGPPPAGIDAPVSRAALLHARASPDVDEQFLSEAGDRVFFGAGSADLGSRARGVIQSQARFLKQHPNLTAAVEGHADDGSMPAPETQRLSEDRAAAVRDRLIAEGISADRLLAFGRGQEERVSNCPTAECMAQNRRAITILLEGRLQLGSRAPRQAAQGDLGDRQGASPTQ